MKIKGIFGGTFDPVHKGHTQITKRLLTDLELDEIIIIPNGIPPHRQAYASSKHRLKMIEIAFQNFRKVRIDDREVTKPKPSYAIETIKGLQKEENSNFLWILGQDAFSKLNTWYKYDEILNLINFLVVTRESPTKKLEYSYKKMHERNSNDLREAYLPRSFYTFKTHPINISSSEARSKLKNSENVDKIIDIDVQDYIQRNNLYE